MAPALNGVWLTMKNKKGFSQWTPMKDNTEYFEPSKKEFMINYGDENLEWLVDQLRKEGVVVLDEIESFDYGKFVHIMDLDGNKIELWEPKDEAFEKGVIGRTKIDIPDLSKETCLLS